VIRAIAVVWVVGCSSGAAPGDRDAGTSLPSDAAVAAAVAAAPPLDAAAFPPTTRTLRVKRSVALHHGPSETSKRIGTIARDIRVGWRRVALGDGCNDPWVELEPRGWVCGSYLEPSDKDTYTVELPKLARGALVPGIYGVVVTEGAVTFAAPKDALVKPAPVVKRTLAGSVKVRRVAEIELGGKVYWKLDTGEYLAANAVRVIEPSRWAGTRIGDETGLSLPVAFAIARKARNDKIPVYDSESGARIVKWLQPRSVAPVLGTAASRLNIGEDQWVDANNMRVAEQTAPPPLTEPDERWVDVDLDRQVLVAYDGQTPVYATLISSGSKRHPTETGVYRVWVKFSETDMTGQMGDEAPYSVATVPWTQFYAKDFALHTAYWHDKFGQTASHGCINLSPVDARFLYFWSGPDVPEGWSMAHGIVERPGSIVRVRSEADPQPELKGYAKRVAEARRASASP